MAPIAAAGGADRHSPWKQELRPVQGVAHGLFVFRGVQSFMREAAAKEALGETERAHAFERIAMIEQEVAEIARLYEDPALTLDGAALVRALIGEGAPVHPATRC